MWTLPEILESRITAFEHKSNRRILGITYRERNTNEYI